MAIGPAARGLGRVFRLTPDVPQQLPFPGLRRMPEVVPQVFNRVLPPRRSTPLPPLPEDIAVRRTPMFEPQERVRTHTLPYKIQDPITGVESSQEVLLKGPTESATKLLLGVGENASPESAVGLIVNDLKNVTTPEELYTNLINIRTLRREYGPRTYSTSRISRGAPASSTGGPGGSVVELAGEETVSLIPDYWESAIDAEIWRAARRVGIPPSEIGDVSELADQTLEAAKAQARIKSEFEIDYKGIGAIATKVTKNKDASPSLVSDVIKEIENHVNSLVMKEYSQGELDRIFSQAGYWIGELQKRIGIDQIFELKQVEKAIAEGLSEDKLHSVFLAAVAGITKTDELQAIGPLARSAIKSETFLDDIDNAVLEKISDIALTARERATNISLSREGLRPPTQLPEMARRPTPFSLRSTPPINPYGNDFQGAMPYALSDLADMKKDWANFGASNLDQWGRKGNRFRSREVYDPETGGFAFELSKWNSETEQFELVARDPKNPNLRRPSVPEYEWIGDPETGRAVRVPLTEFQNFFHRIAEPSSPTVRKLTPIERIRESLETQAAAYGIDSKTAVGVANKVEEILNQTISSGKVVEGTPEYAWMHTVFGRLALDVSGPGYLAGTKRTAGLVSHDANHTRRLAALIALDKVEQTGIVPAEVLIYIRAEAKRAEDAYKLAIKNKPARPKLKRKMSKAEREAITTPSMTEETEAASIRQLMKESEKAQERLRKAAKRESK